MHQPGTEVPKMKVVVERDRLYRELHLLQAVLTEYAVFLEALPGTPDWETKAIEMLRQHQVQLERARATLRTLDLVAAFVRELVLRSGRERFTFTPRAPSVASAAPPAEAGTAGLARLLEELHTIVEHAPLALQEKLRLLLGTVEGLVAAVQADDRQRVNEALGQINLLTSSQESRGLIREIALIARDVYDSLNAFSDDLPLDGLSESAEGISEAVRRLRSVMVRLEESAMHNLESLESSANRVGAAKATIDRGLDGLRRVQQKLGEIKYAHPETAEAITALQDNLGDGIGSPLMMILSRVEANRESYMSLMANQSFQDLTGQTLKKIIAFIEHLQEQLMALLGRYRPMLGTPQPRPGGGAQHLESAQDNPGRQSQDQVDALLADLGF